MVQPKDKIGMEEQTLKTTQQWLSSLGKDYKSSRLTTLEQRAASINNQRNNPVGCFIQMSNTKQAKTRRQNLHFSETALCNWRDEICSFPTLEEN